MVESNRHKEGWLIFTFYVFHLFSQKIKLLNCFFNKYTDLCQRRLSGLFPHNWLPHEINLFNPLNSQSHFPGTWQHQIKLAGHNHSLFLLYVINFKLADALKKKKKNPPEKLSRVWKAKYNYKKCKSHSHLLKTIIWKGRYHYIWVHGILMRTFF